MRFYGDISGAADGDDALVVAAGYVGYDRQWSGFDSDWRFALSDARASYFHATDFYARRDVFEWLRENPRLHHDLARRFAAIAEVRTRIGVAYGVIAGPDYDTLATGFGTWWTPNGRMTAQMFAATMVMTWIASHVARKPSHPVTACWEEGGGIGAAIELWRWLKKRDEPWTRAYNSFEVGTKDSLGLQGADLLAHEAWHWCRAASASQSADLSRIRSTFARLLRRRRLMIAVLKQSEHADLARVFSEYASVNRGGVDPRARPYRGKLPSERGP